jgi:signal transduction histidine kinase
VSRRSLRYRLLAAAAGSILVALLLAGVGLAALFERHLERRLDAELEVNLRQLVGRVELSPEGRVHVAGDLADPRFEAPLGGLYWQVQDDTRPTLLRSRSLWDAVIPLPEDVLTLGEAHRHILPGPAEQMLLVRERQVIAAPDTHARRLRVAVAIDRAELDAALRAFIVDMLPYFAVLAMVLLGGAWLQVRTGLAPLERLRRGVLAVRGGSRSRLDQAYPDEVVPLVEEINELLEARDRSVERARAWTADLAHGLKTPLSALAGEAERLRAAGEGEAAERLDQLAEAMRRRVDRELIRARLRSAGPAVPCCTELAPAVRRVTRTLERTPHGERLEWQVGLPEDLRVAVQPDDLTELLGNLLDNAGKWAERRVEVTAGAEGGAVVLTVADDGPGVPAGERERLGGRGVRLDEQTPGHGLGLAIVRDILEAYGGELSFGRSPAGGLSVQIRLPQKGDGGIHV